MYCRSRDLLPTKYILCTMVHVDLRYNVAMICALSLSLSLVSQHQSPPGRRWCHVPFDEILMSQRDR